MTTIAYRDGVLAADSQVSYGDTAAATTQKIFRSEKGDLVGVAGRLYTMALMRTWVERGCKGNPPNFDDGSGLWVKPDGSVHIIDSGQSIPVEGEFHACGSGSEFAFGAMAMGAPAKEAVEVAARFDGCTGGPFQSITRD